MTNVITGANDNSLHSERMPVRRVQLTLETVSQEKVSQENAPATTLSLTQVIQKYQAAVCAYFRTRLFLPNDVEDLAQEVFVRFYTGNQQEEDSPERTWDLESLRPWLLGIARNVLREHLRKLNSRRELLWTEFCLELEENSPEESFAEDQETLEDLRECVETLGQTARQAITLKYGHDRTLKEIRTKLHRSEGAVKLLVFRARQALKRCLDFKQKEREHQEELGWF